MSTGVNTRFLTLIGLIFAAALSRLVPHPPNFTPITAMALFGGCYVSDKKLAFILPLGALFLSDIVLGFYHGMWLIYGCFALFVGFGLWLRKHRTFSSIAGTVLFSSVLFFTITNFGVWAMENLYPKTSSGLLACYIAGLPFFRYELLGTLFYSGILFGSFAFLEKHWPSLRQSATA